MDPDTQLTFARPELLALIPVALVVGIVGYWVEQQRRRRANRFQSERLRGVGLPARAAAPWLWSLAVVSALVAIAGPRYGMVEMPTMMSTQSTVVVLDVSNSMLVEDIGAPRLSVAKAITNEVLNRIGGRVGLVVFEGSAETLAPITDDHAAVRLMLESIGTGELVTAGSSIALALTTALDLFERAGTDSGTVILVSDGENRGGTVDQALEAARERNVRIHTVLVGTLAGGPIPAEDGSFRDDDGRVVVSRARPEDLRRIASETGGSYFENPFNESGVREIASTIGRGGTAEDDATIAVPADRYQLPLGIALVFFLLSSFVRRGAE